MGKEYPAKSFKSGNSVAVRMPAALNIEPGKDWVVTERDGEYVLKAKEEPKLKLDVDRFWGKAKGMFHVPTPREDFDPRPSSLNLKS